MSAQTASPLQPLLPQQIELAEIQNPAVRRALELWERLRGPRAFPARADLSPRQMPDLLRNIALVRVLEGGEDFQFRVIGDGIVVAQGASFQGMTTNEVDRILPGYGAALAGIYRRVLKSRRPLAFRGWYEREADGHSFFHESISLPFGPDPATVDHILVAAVYARGYHRVYA